jgi:hypothetical protein
MVLNGATIAMLDSLMLLVPADTQDRVCICLSGKRLIPTIEKNGSAWKARERR